MQFYNLDCDFDNHGEREHEEREAMVLSMKYSSSEVPKHPFETLLCHAMMRNKRAKMLLVYL